MKRDAILYSHNCKSVHFNFHVRIAHNNESVADTSALLALTVAYFLLFQHSVQATSQTTQCTVAFASSQARSACNFNNCIVNLTFLKHYLQYTNTCMTKVPGGCKLCRCLLSSQCSHAQDCMQSNCSIRKYMHIQKHIRQLPNQHCNCDIIVIIRKQVALFMPV